MIPVWPSYPTIAGPEQFNIAQTQQKTVNQNVKVIKVLKEEMNKLKKSRKM